jgi:4-hydroxybenzoate polyprenyltransferase
VVRFRAYPQSRWDGLQIAVFPRFVAHVPQIHIAPNSRKITIFTTSERLCEHALDSNNAMPNRWIALLRLDKPAGIWLLLWPCWWGVTLASRNAGQEHTLFSWPNIRLLLLFAVGAVVMRAAGCVINDLWDRRIDAQVERTRSRPLASGAIKPWQALALLAVLLGLGGLVLVQLPPAALVWGVLSLPLVGVYPLMKRLTWWPQAFLGLIFNWGVLMGWAAVQGTVTVAPLLLYAGGVFWTLGYDTLYACQDRADDARIGVRSSALRLGGQVRTGILWFYALAALFLSLGALAGGISIWFFAVFGVGCGVFFRFLRTVNLDDPTACLAAFKANVLLGGIVWVALVAGLFR